MTENPNPNPNPNPNLCSTSTMELRSRALTLVLVLAAHSPLPALSSPSSPLPKSLFVPPPKQQKAGHPTLHSPPPPRKQAMGHPTLHFLPPRGPIRPLPKQVMGHPTSRTPPPRDRFLPPPKQVMGHPNPRVQFLPPHLPVNCPSCHNLVRSHDKRRLNFGKLMGVVFVAIAVALQVALGAFLAYKRRQLRKVERQWLPASTSSS